SQLRYDGAMNETVEGPMTTEQDRRRAPRVSVDVPVELRFTFEPAGHGRASDVSKEGMFAETDELRPAGSLVEIRLDGGRGSEPIMAWGVVARQVIAPPVGLRSGRKGLGILLTATSEEWENFLQDAVGHARRKGNA